ncbi:MAG: TniB family NTP-binding protein [Bradyrhizobium sp.]
MTTKPNNPLIHLRDSLPAELKSHFSAIERMKAIFMPTPREAELAEEMNLLINNAVQCKDPELPLTLENRSEGKGLVVIGPTGVGKTKSLRHFFDNHAAFAGYRDPASASPLLWITAPSPCNIVQLGRRILVKSGYPLDRELPAHRLFELVGQRLNAMGKIVLFIEEFQHVVHNVSVRDQETVADTLKNLMETERLTLILSGVETLTPFIALDPQLDRRLTKIYFRELTPQDHDTLADMVHAYAEEAGVEVAYSDTDFLFARLSHASLNALGLSIETTIAAIAHCLRKGEKTLIREHFAAVYAAKWSRAAPDNPFLADRWHEINCRTHVDKANASGPSLATARGAKPNEAA